MRDVIENFRQEEIAASRVVLRKARAADLDGLVMSQTDPKLRSSLGGPRPEDQVRAFLANVGVDAVTSPPGSFIVADKLSRAMLGTMLLDRRDPDLPGHVTADGNELELSYVLLAKAWGQGYVTEAGDPLLAAAARVLPDQPVLIVTQSANSRALAVAERLGFGFIETFEQFGAEQSLLSAALGAFANG